MMPQTPDWKALTERLERVERGNRQLKRVGGILLAGAIGVVLMGQGFRLSRTVEADEFVVRDASGAVRGRLGVGELRLQGPGGKGQLLLTSLPDGGGVVIADADGKPRLGLAGSSDGAALTLGATNGPWVNLSLGYGRLPRLLMTDEKGNTRAALGEVQIRMPRTGNVETRSVSSLVLFGPDGTAFWQTP